MTGSQKRQKKNSPQSNKSYYPVYLDLKGKRCIIVGGGRVAERKCRSLIKNGADVTVISPNITKRLEDYKRKGKIRHLPRLYRRGDIESAFLAIAATDSQETNKKVYTEAMDKNILLNVVDNPDFCNFIAPSVFECGDLKIAISTGGTSPAVAKRIRKELEALYNHEFSKYLNFLKRIRGLIKDKVKKREEREAIFNYLSSPEIFSILREKGFAALKKKVTKALSNRL
ncbi:MAG: bifunctional precorrin-2 dehydrogenase/sirohydrochlorin ferrochelatase [Thermodesulfovibrionales bacterium]